MEAPRYKATRFFISVRHIRTLRKPRVRDVVDTRGMLRDTVTHLTAVVARATFLELLSTSVRITINA